MYYIAKEKKEYVLSNQLLRSGTAPCALVREAEHAESRADFIHKMSIGLKEINDTDYLTKEEYNSVIGDTERDTKITNLLS